MKKELLVLFISLLCLTLIYAEETSIPVSPLSDITPEQSITTFQEKSNNILDKDLSIPVYLEKPLRIIFGIKETQTLDLSQVILLSVLLIGFLFLLHLIVAILPFFEGTFKSWLATVIILLLIATTGALNQSANFLFSLMNFFDILSKWSILKILAAIILSTIIIGGLSILIKIMEEKTRPEKARMTGFKTGTGGIFS